MELICPKDCRYLDDCPFEDKGNCPLQIIKEENKRIPITIPCERCGGFGFSGYGTGYDAVCDECGGIGETCIGWKEEDNYEIN